MKRFFVRQIFLLVAALPWLAGGVGAQTDFYLRDGDRVVFYGDSITEQNHFAAWIEAFALTRFPQKRLEFVNAGWSGDWTVGGGGGKMPERVRRDVAAQRPSVVVVMLGMNDGGYRAFDQSFFDVYADGYRKLIVEIKRTTPNARLTLLRPSPFDEITRSSGEWRTVAPQIPNGGYNRVLVRYGDFVAETGRENDFVVVDANAPVVAVIEKLNASDANAAASIIPDRIHPGEAGGLVIAAAILKKWNASPLVSNVEIDARRKTILAAQNARVSDLKTNNGFSWRQTDAALPLPINPDYKTLALAAQAGNIYADLNRQTLKITNLSGARYELKIDGQAVGVWTSAELAAGVNLAEYKTPMLKQAREIYELAARRAKIRFFRWREIELPLAKVPTPALRQTATDLSRLENEIIAEQKRAAQPAAHNFTLAPVD